MGVFIQQISDNELRAFFAANGLVAGLERIADPKLRAQTLMRAVTVTTNVNGDKNVTVYPFNKNGVVVFNSNEVDCYVVSDRQIYQLQDKLSAYQLKRLFDNYGKFMRRMNENYPSRNKLPKGDYSVYSAENQF